MVKILTLSLPWIHNIAGAFSCKFPYSLTLFSCSILIKIDLWELKITSKYAKKQICQKIRRM